MNLTTAHTLWLAPLCLALGAGLAWWLYRRQRDREGFAPRMAWAMALLRAVAVSLIAFFLLEPMLRLMVREVRKPVVAILHDGSSSLMAAGDTASLRTAYAEELRQLVKDLGDRYQVRAFTYGAGLREGLLFDQDEQSTDISGALRALHDRLSGPDLGAVVIDGDGIQNRGRDPRLDADRLGVPVFTIALGDTTVKPDLAVRGVEHNRISFLGNEFPVRVRISAQHLRGARSRVVVSQAGAELASQELGVRGDPFHQELTFLMKADMPGTRRFTVEASPIDGEASIANNRQDFFVEVLDARQKVLLLGAAPHPDLGALRSALGGLEGYVTEIAYAGDFSGPPEAYDLIVLHQLPNGRGDGRAVIDRARTKGIPLLFVLGQATDMAAFNGMAAGVRVTGTRTAITDAQAAVAPEFALFSLEQDLARSMERYPPLQVPFGQYELQRGASALARQRVGAVRTDAPLIAVMQQEGQRAAVVCGEGLWRWRLADHQASGSHERFDRLAHKLVQFLALKADKDRFRVEHAPVVPGNEPLLFTAEYYNAAYEPVADAEVTAVLTSDSGEEYAFTFRPYDQGYRLNAGQLPVGRYRWKAHAMHKGERLQDEGEVHVQALYLEQVTTVADHALLADLAARTGGRVLKPGALAGIVESMEQDRIAVARSFAQPRFSDLIEWRWLFFLIALLLAAEWSLRRRSGAY